MSETSSRPTSHPLGQAHHWASAACVTAAESVHCRHQKAQVALMLVSLETVYR